MSTLIALHGPSGSGKTTLLTAVIPQLRQWGLQVGAVKHSHHRVEPDHPGKDSHRLRQAGAQEVILLAGNRWALFAETGEPPALENLLARLDPELDLVLLEGFSSEGLPHLRLYRAAVEPEPPELHQSGLLAVVTDVPMEAPCPCLPLNDPSQVARFLYHYHRHRLEESSP